MTYFLFLLIAVPLFFVCRDNNKYADELTEVLKNTNKNI